MTLEITIDDELMEEMQFQSGIYSRSKLCSEWISIYKWMLNMACDGRRIIAEDAEGKHHFICDAVTFRNIENRFAKFHQHGRK